MGQDELVLKIPAKPPLPPTSSMPSTASGASPPDASAPTTTTTRASSSPPSSSALKCGKQMTHSRESSGASVKFVSSVRSSNTGSSGNLAKRHRRGSSGGTAVTDDDIDDIDVDEEVDDNIDDDDDDARVVVIFDHAAASSTRISSEEDEGRGAEDRLSPESVEDRLSPESEDLDIDDGARMLRRGPPTGAAAAASAGNPDSKSQNSDYGSFCNTPNCDTNAAAVTTKDGAPTATTTSSTTTEPSGARSRSGGGSSPPRGGGGQPAPDDGGHDDDKEEDNSMMDGYQQRQPLLNSTSHPDSCSSDEDAGGANASGYTRRKTRQPPKDGNRSNDVQIDIDADDEDDEDNGSEAPLDEVDRDGIPREPLKTLLAFVWIFFAWVATVTSLAMTHDRVPQTKPLPDTFLDNVQYQKWGLDASEIIIMVAMAVTITLVVFHQHRFVVLRRIFFVGGIHYYYRAITMYVTVLPKPDLHYPCAPQSNDTTVLVILQRMLKLLSGAGLSINEQHVYCGDYIYSGHTMTLVMTFLIIKEYSPRRWFLLHWLSFCTTVTGVLTLLFARGHYSIDVVLAYWVTTRIWWIYHTMANNPEFLKGDGAKHNYLLNIWWMYIFRYFEAGVGRPLPKGFNFPWPKRLTRFRPDFLAPARSRRRRGDPEEGGATGSGSGSSSAPVSRLP